MIFSAPNSNPNQRQDRAHDPAPIEWALLGASLRTLVVLTHSPGRNPVRLLSLVPDVTWQRADGGTECLTGDSRSLATVQREIMGRGLLVGEYSLGQAPDALPVDTWLLRPAQGVRHG